MTMPRAGSASRVYSPDLSTYFGNMADRSFGAGRTRGSGVAGKKLAGTFRRVALCALAVSLLVLSAALPVLAATDTVNSTADNSASLTTVGTLRYWLANAAAGDTLIFSVTGTITLDCTDNGSLAIRKDVSISGPGAANLAISGGLPSPSACGVFVVVVGATATISGVTIENGNSANGGGIFSTGTLTVSNSTLSGNTAGQYGGGIFSEGTLTVSGSTLSGNKTPNSIGGGIYIGNGTATMSNSTLSGNSAVLGGGILNSGTLTVSNSTLSGNSASAGGGIYNYGGTLTVSNSTLSGNSAAASDGGGIFQIGGALTLKSTLLANESSGGNCAVSGTATSDGYNLTDDSSCSFLTASTDQSDVTAGTYLGPLANNGGPTQTIALLPGTPGSTAIDAIPVNECTDASSIPVQVSTDQRGIARPQGKGCEIGAYELAQPVPTANVCTGAIVTDCGTTIHLNYYVPSGTTLASTTPVTVVTQGAPGLDFTLASTTCTSTLATPAQCTVTVTFAPIAPGLRLGAVTLTDSLGNPFATTLIDGIGTGSALAFTPGIISTVAGNGTAGYSGDGGPAASAELSYPYSVAVDSAGTFYIADNNNSVRKVNASGVISTLAGNGTAGYSGDGGPATSARLSGPAGVAVDGAGNLYIADQSNQRIRKVTAATGIITTVAGNGTAGYSGDGGPATSAELNFPAGVAVDSAGNLYIADYNNSVIRKVNTSGIMTTVAGNGTGGYSGDSGPATSAELYLPIGVAVDGTGNLYIADTGNQRIRKVDASGIITTVAGNGTAGYSGDGGLAISAQLDRPTSAAVDSAGNLYIADTGNQRIRKVNASGIITTVAGNGTFGYSGDGGAATSAEFYDPDGVAVDSAGNLYIADANNQRIRKVNVTISALSFPTTDVGQSSTAQSVVISDVGNASLNFISFGISSNFQFLSPIGGDCLVGTALAAGADCNLLGAFFAPLIPGNPVTGTITVADDAFDSPQSVRLSGIATPGLVATPTSIAVDDAATNSNWNNSEVTGASAYAASLVSRARGGPLPSGSVSYNLYGNGTCSGSPVSTSTVGLSVGTVPNSAASGPLASGSYSFSASYSGDSYYDVSTSACAPFSVNQAPTQTAVVSSVNPSTVGQSVTFTATVSGVGGFVPTGTVGFTDNGNPISGCSSVAVSSGTAQCTTSALAAGPDSIVAIYSGDSNYLSSPGKLVQQVNTPAVATSTSVSSSLNPSFTSAPNNNVTFTATVTYSGSTPVTSGTVTFSDNGNPLCSTVALNGSGQATCTTSFTLEGNHPITAAYSGAVNFFLTSNGGLSQGVNNHTVVTGNQFCNQGPITIPNTAGGATPYPSNIFVTGLSGNIGAVTLALNGINSSNMQPTDLLLVGPTGAQIIPFANIGDGSTISGVNVTLDDAASSPLLAGVPLSAGTYRPTSLTGGTSLSFPSPAPTATAAEYAASDGAATLTTTFGNTAPNGTWALYAIANASGGASSISGGWCVNITPPAVTLVNPNTGQQGQQNESVAITGQFTHFVQGTTTANFGPDITVASLTVNSATSATAILNISQTATLGAVNVTLTTGEEAATLANGFTVTPGTGSLNVLKKGGTSAGTSTVGQTISYTFFITNTGSLTLTSVGVNDTNTAPAGALTSGPTCQSLSSPAGQCSGSTTTLVPGQSASFTASYTITQADINNGSVSDSATASGTPPSGPVVTSTPSTATVTMNQAPSVGVVKSVTSTGPYNTVGQTISYSFTVANTGNVTLTPVGVSDTGTAPAGALTSGPTCQALSTPAGTCSGSTTTLVPGQSATFTATYTITQADINNGSVADSATASGTPPSGPVVTSNPSTATVTVTQSPAVGVVKSVTSMGPYNTVGQTISYSFTVTNTGNVMLTSVGVSDTGTAPAGALTSGPTCQALSTPAGSCTGSTTTLVPGQSATFTATYTITQADINNGSVADSATASGTPPSGPSVTSSPSTATVTVTQTPAMTLAKSASITSYSASGTPVTYSFKITNTGNITLTSVGVTDPHVGLSAISCPSSTLVPLAFETCTAAYTTTAADVTAGSITNTATASGTPPSGSIVGSNTSTVTIPVGTATVSVGTNPAGLAFTVDNGGGPITYTTTQTFTWTIGTQHTIATTTPQAGLTGTQYVWSYWSDSGLISHKVTAMATTTSYTANFATQYQLTTAASPASGGTVTPASGTFYNAGAIVSLTAAPAAGYVFSSWAGPVANSNSASTTVSMSGSESVTANFVSALTIAPPNINFGTVYLGSISTKNVTLTNNGTTALTINDPFFSILKGGNSNEFGAVNLCPKSLAAGKHCTIAIVFVAGPYYTPQTAALSIMDSAPGSPQTVMLTATVINPQASFNPNSLNFGTKAVNSSTTQTVKLRNTGTTALSGIGMTVTGENASDFTLTPSSNCGSSVAAGNSCTISVTFKPAAKGSRAARLKIADNALPGTQTVLLSGIGH